MCDLPHDLVWEKILPKIPITSLRQVRSTCKLWDASCRDWILGQAATRQHQFLGFMLTDHKVCSLRFHLRRKEEEEREEDMVDLDVSRNQVDLLSQFKIDLVFHCDGLLLCVDRDDSKLVVWNPYLGQTRWIGLRKDTCFDTNDNYALGYDMNRNHKILRLLGYPCFNDDGERLFVFEIYDLTFDSWRVVKVIGPDWKFEHGHHNRGGVSLKGNTYFWAYGNLDGYEQFLVCFDFTTERFGQPLHLPFLVGSEDTLSVSSVRDEKLALLRQKGEALEIWITTKIELNDVTWCKFMDVDMRHRGEVWFDAANGSFFIDEEERVAVVFHLAGHDSRDDELTQTTVRHHTAFIIGEDGYYKSVSLGVATQQWCPQPPRVCSSSYLPSLVQLTQTRKRKERDEC